MGSSDVSYEFISLTTDYGLADPFVGVCHGVIARILPDVRVIDVTHGVPAGDIRHGAFAIAQSVPYLPPAVHVGVVDPGVGTARRGIVIATPGGLLVGPDNGLLPPAADVLGGVVESFELTAAEYRLPRVSSTFHGRDVFCPAAAHLASGVAPAEFGPRVPASELVRLPLPAPTVRRGGVVTEVAAVDHFGNVQLTAPESALTDAGFGAGEHVLVRVGEVRHRAVVGSTFADVDDGDLIVLADSAGLIALAVNGGSAAARLGLIRRDGVHECSITALSAV